MTGLRVNGRVFRQNDCRQNDFFWMGSFMGIKCKEGITLKTQDEFHAIDEIATGFAFDIQNTMGKSK